MKKRLAVFLLTIVTGVGIHLRFFYYRVWLSTTSPTNQYTVELTGDKRRGGPLMPSSVKYNVLSNGQYLAKDRLAHSDDNNYLGFEQAYPEHAWINENTLRFWRNSDNSEPTTLLISNRTDRAIKFARILGGRDMFLIFDIPPRSSMKLAFSNELSGNNFLIDGEFDDGSVLFYGAGFVPSDRVGQHFGYCMTVDHGTVTMSSPYERGYDYRGQWNRHNLDPSPACQP